MRHGRRDVQGLWRRLWRGVGLLGWGLGVAGEVGGCGIVGGGVFVGNDCCWVDSLWWCWRDCWGG